VAIEFSGYMVKKLDGWLLAIRVIFHIDQGLGVRN
jgi:hypothetical protein